MRIIAGKYSAREIKSPKGHRTHPMAEKVRGAMFNSLGDVSGLTVLDAYAGSGALGFEALSRGAEFVQFVDIDKKAYDTCCFNEEVLGIGGKAKITRANIGSWSSKSTEKKFDLILCDPPYDQLNLKTVAKLTTHLNPNGLMVLSFAGRESVPTVNGVVVVDTREYGDAALAFYRFRSDATNNPPVVQQS